jgi:2-polyprenyl-6-methoxyphenol hydroxylase-like FAD-dependent oxidoreductase
MSMDTVIVVGAGPTGLLLAGDLARSGVDVTVLERRDAGISNLTRAFGVHARTLEQLDARGLADDLVARGTPVARLRLLGRLEVGLDRLPTRFPYVLITPQYEVERLLFQQAREMGVHFEHGVTVTGLTQDDGSVTVETSAGLRQARYVVGADGIHSGVRKALGLPFPGRSVVRSMMLADVRLSEPPPGGVLAVNASEAGFAMIVSFGDGWYRVMGWDRARQVGDDVPVDVEELRALLKAVHGTDFGLHDARWTSRFHADERQVPRYRVGDVFLAGDAAHIHTPAGGQGMNTGLQDAANLSWKLAGAVQGWLPPRLLDSYQHERHPVGAAVVRSSGALIRLALAGGPLPRLARAALAAVVPRVPAIQRRIIGQVSGVAIAYGSHRRAPDITLRGGRLYEALRSGRFLLVGTTIHGYADRVDEVSPVTPGPALLVRPDGYIAAAGTPDEVRRAVPEWCGPPLSDGA